VSKPDGISFMKKGKDEYYTPKVMVDRLFPEFDTWADRFFFRQKRYPVVWCPFDTAESNFVKVFEQKGVEVVRSHISEPDGDFFTRTVPWYDIAISNPPFSRKMDVFKRLDSLGKPWAMLMNLMVLNYNDFNEYFSQQAERGRTFGVLLFTKKMSFDGNQAAFNTSYFCRDWIDGFKWLQMRENNVGKRFEG